MNSDDYFSVSRSAEGEYKEKGSKFISYIAPVSNDLDFRAFLERIKKAHHQARHHCYAYRLTPDSGDFRSNDDREPSGSAGKPILGQIRSHELFEVGIIVVRYFGGTLLGVPGLIRSYKNAAESAISNAVIIEKTIEVRFHLQFNYEDTSEVMSILTSFNPRIVKQEFDQRCDFEFALGKAHAVQFQKKLIENHLLKDKIKLKILRRS